MNETRLFKESTAKVDVFSLDGRMTDKIDVPVDILDGEINSDLIHRVIQWQLFKRRSGNHQTKNVSEVSGSTRKFLRQKGTGNARHCTKRVNIFRGGAKVFGPVTHDHAISMNKKEKELGLRMAMTYAIKTNSFFVIKSFDEIDLKDPAMKKVAPKTSYWKEICKPWHGNTCLLIGEAEESKNIFLATRNIPQCNFLVPEGINVYDIMRNHVVLVSQKALYNIIKRLGYE